MLPLPSLFFPQVLDVAVCWNYLVVVDTEGISKFGLVEGGKNAARRLPLPPDGRRITQLSATPRHLLAVTDNGGKEEYSINVSFIPDRSNILKFWGIFPRLLNNN